MHGISRHGQMIVMGNLWNYYWKCQVEKKEISITDSQLVKRRLREYGIGTMLEHTIRYRIPERHERRSGGKPVETLTGGVLRWAFLSCG